MLRAQIGNDAFHNLSRCNSLLPDSLIYYGNFRNHPYYYSLPDHLALSQISLISRKNAFLPRASTEYALQLKQLVDVGTWRMGSNVPNGGLNLT